MEGEVKLEDVGSATIFGRRMTVLRNEGQDHLVGKEVAALIGRQTFNLYRSLKMRGIPVLRASDAQVLMLSEVGAIATTTRSASLIPMDLCVEFVEESLSNSKPWMVGGEGSVPGPAAGTRRTKRRRPRRRGGDTGDEYDLSDEEAAVDPDDEEMEAAAADSTTAAATAASDADSSLQASESSGVTARRSNRRAATTPPAKRSRAAGGRGAGRRAASTATAPSEDEGGEPSESPANSSQAPSTVHQWPMNAAYAAEVASLREQVSRGDRLAPFREDLRKAAAETTPALAVRSRARTLMAIRRSLCGGGPTRKNPPWNVHRAVAAVDAQAIYSPRLVSDAAKALVPSPSAVFGILVRQLLPICTDSPILQDSILESLIPPHFSTESSPHVVENNI